MSGSCDGPCPQNGTRRSWLAEGEEMERVGGGEFEMKMKGERGGGGGLAI